jgi:hypothetical protein
MISEKVICAKISDPVDSDLYQYASPENMLHGNQGKIVVMINRGNSGEFIIEGYIQRSVE